MLIHKLKVFLSAANIYARIFMFFPACAGLLLSVIFSSYLFAQDKLYIEKGKEEYIVGNYISMLEDKENRLTINEVVSQENEKNFVHTNKESLNLGFSGSVFWLRFDIVDTLAERKLPASNNWFLINNDPMLEDIRLYYRSANGELIETRSGRMVPLKDKPIETIEFISRIPVIKNSTNTFYFRISSKSQTILSFRLLSPSKYFNERFAKTIYHGIFFGILLLLMSYNLFLYFSVKENTYIFYVLYVFSYSFALFNYEGYYYWFVNNLFAMDYYILPMTAFASLGLFWLLLTRDFLSTKLYYPSVYRLLNYLSVIAALNIILVAIFHEYLMLRIFAISNLIFFIICAVVAIIILRRGNKISIFYILALSGAGIGTIIMGLRRNGFLPMTFWTENALYLGLLWETIILAYTVGYRFSLLKLEKEKEKESIRNQIAADLHDEVGSNLSTISLQSQMMMRTGQLDTSSREQLQDIIKTAGLTTDTIRDIVWFINPFHDNSEDLVLRMKELASKMLVNCEYTFNSISNGSVFNALPDLRKRRHIYLIYKEVLNNICKHAKAEEVNITLSADNSEFIMSIVDNGSGFNELHIKKGEGLKNLRNRAEQMQSQICIKSENGKGTNIILKVPVR